MAVVWHHRYSAYFYTIVTIDDEIFLHCWRAETVDEHVTALHATLSSAVRIHSTIIITFFVSPRLYAIYHTPIIRFIIVHFSLSFFIHLCVQFCSYLCIILFCLLHVLILCIVCLCILCIFPPSLWLLYCNKRVCEYQSTPECRLSNVYTWSSSESCAVDLCM